MLRPIHLSEGLRYFSKSIKRKISGPKQYSGDARQICKGIIDDCWNGKYFMNTAGHFHEFWSRDFGCAVDSLIKLGHKDKVEKTLAYALEIYQKNGKITSAINPGGIPFNFPQVYSPDSVALLLRSLHAAKAHDLIKKHKPFLNSEIKKFYDVVFDKDSGLVKRKVHFSGWRDYYVRDSSCYDNIMLAVLADTLDKNKILYNPFKGYDIKKNIKDSFWTGSYFLDDLSGNKHVTGDANIFPFWLDIFSSRKMLKSAVDSMHSSKLDKPLPLKYVHGDTKERKIFLEFLVPDWEHDAVWPHLGFMYIKLLKRIDKNRADKQKRAYANLIERYKNFYELYTPDLKPYKSLFYMSDESVIWCANFLTL